MSAASEARTLERAQSLLERVLRPGAAPASPGGSLARAYPLVFGRRFPGKLVAFEERGDVRAACAYLVRELVIPGARLRVGLVGSLATDPLWRGQGLATRVLEETERCLAREGCLLALARASEPGFLRKRDWLEFGARVELELDEAALARLPRVDGIRAAGPDDFAAIQRLYARHPERVDRSSEEAAALLAGPSHETLVLCRTRDVAAYASTNLARERQPVVEEWGGRPGDVLGLLREQARRARDRSAAAALTVLCPPSARELRGMLAELGARSATLPLAVGKVLDVEHAAELLASFGWPEAARVELEASGSAVARILMTGPSGRRSLDKPELMEVLFARASSRQVLESLERELACALPRLPLCPFVWGLDSI